MEKQFFKNTETLLRQMEGPFGPYIESFARLLTDQGYAQCSVGSRLRLIADFTHWLEQQRIIVKEITPEHIKQYLKQPHCSARKGYALTLQRFLDLLCKQGVIQKETTSIEQTPVELLADEFRSYLRQERALAEPTVIYYLNFISRFLKDRFGDGEVNLSALCAADVVGFVERQAASLHPKRAKVMTTALRSFLQYARYRGDLKIDLVAAVPTVANWAMASIPRFLPPYQIELVLASCNRQTAVGRRDYAILLLLARLGRVLSVSHRDGSFSSVYSPERLIHYFWRIYYDRSISVRSAQT